MQIWGSGISLFLGVRRPCEATMTNVDFINLLLVDDQDVFRKGLKLGLAGLAGLVVVGEAAGGREALRKTLELMPDVVIMDYEMPDGDGVEATRQIKELAPNTRVLMLSSHEDPARILAALRAGADGYCLKKGAMRGLYLAIRSVAMGALWLDPAIARSVMTEFAIASSPARTDAVKQVRA